jgi:hypothetical protein
MSFQHVPSTPAAFSLLVVEYRHTSPSSPNGGKLNQKEVAPYWKSDLRACSTAKVVKQRAR